MEPISICFTNYNRVEMVLLAVATIIDDRRVSEVIICDDASNEEVVEALSLYQHPKYRLYVNEKNLGMSRNKAKAISLATNQWVCIFDSDNLMYGNYIDAFERVGMHHNPAHVGYNPNIIYMPDGAMPSFNYSEWSGMTLDTRTVKRYIDNPMFGCLLNTCNYIVHRDSYLEVYQEKSDISASDTIYFNYLWLKSGGMFFVVPGMSYNHRVHNDSGWLKDADNSHRLFETIKWEIKDL